MFKIFHQENKDYKNGEKTQTETKSEDLDSFSFIQQGGVAYVKMEY